MPRSAKSKFRQLVDKLTAKLVREYGYAWDVAREHAKGLAAEIGRKKYGAEEMARRARLGRRHAEVVRGRGK